MEDEVGGDAVAVEVLAEVIALLHDDEDMVPCQPDRLSGQASGPSSNSTSNAAPAPPSPRPRVRRPAPPQKTPRMKKSATNTTRPTSVASNIASRMS